MRLPKFQLHVTTYGLPFVTYCVLQKTHHVKKGPDGVIGRRIVSLSRLPGLLEFPYIPFPECLPPSGAQLWCTPFSKLVMNIIYTAIKSHRSIASCTVVFINNNYVTSVATSTHALSLATTSRPILECRCHRQGRDRTASINLSSLILVIRQSSDSNEEET